MKTATSAVEVLSETNNDETLVQVISRQEMERLIRTEMEKKYEVPKADMDIKWSEDGEIASLFCYKPLVERKSVKADKSAPLKYNWYRRCQSMGRTRK